MEEFAADLLVEIAERVKCSQLGALQFSVVGQTASEEARNYMDAAVAAVDAKSSASSTRRKSDLRRSSSVVGRGSLRSNNENKQVYKDRPKYINLLGGIYM